MEDIATCDGSFALPPVAVARRQLHVLFLLDRSGSMAGDKIASLNYAMSATLPSLRDVADDNPEVEVRLRVLSFATGAAWESDGFVGVERYEWSELRAGGETGMGGALAMAAAVLDPAVMTGRQLRPIVVLVSDGCPSDDFEAGLAALRAAPYGAESLRIAVAIGRDADCDVLQAFLGSAELAPLRAHNAHDLVAHVQWATTTAVKAVSSPTIDPAPAATLATRAQAWSGADSDMVW